MTYKIKITSLHTEILCDEKKTLLENLHLNNILINSNCGGKGTCGKCKVRFLSGIIPEPHEKDSEFLDEHELQKGMRLACKTLVAGEAVIDISSNLVGKTVFQTACEINKNNLPFNPSLNQQQIVCQPIKPLKGDLENMLSDEECITRAYSDLKKLSFSLSAMKKIPHIIKNHGLEKIYIVHDNHTVLDIWEKQQPLLGVAIDLGTTTIAVEVIDLENEQTIGVDACLNPQRLYGDDVISRIHYISRNFEKGLDELRNKVIDSINQCIRKILSEHHIPADSIMKASVAGNSTMTHIFLGINPERIAFAPYLPIFRQAQPVKAHEAGLKINPEGLVYTFANLGGFLGGDTVADLLVFNIFDSAKQQVLVDVGTNGEIVISGKNGVFASTAAAGPAFEGAKIRMGMRAESGAVDKFSIADNGEVSFSTIHNSPAKGICGSGLVDITAELIRVGIIDSGGRILSPDQIMDNEIARLLAPRIFETENGRAFLIAYESQNAECNVFVYQQDIRELQLAKGAIAAGIKMLAEKAGCKLEEISNFYLAGAFGNFIPVKSAKRIGLIPEGVNEEKISSLGNAALAGAGLSILYSEAMEIARNKIPESITFVELAGNLDFQEHFAENMLFL